MGKCEKSGAHDFLMLIGALRLVIELGRAPLEVCRLRAGAMSACARACVCWTRRVCAWNEVCVGGWGGEGGGTQGIAYPLP